MEDGLIHSRSSILHPRYLPGCRFDAAPEGAELGAVGADLLEGTDLLDLQLRHLLRSSPDDGPTARMRLLGEDKGPLRATAQGLLQDFDDQLKGVVVVVFEDDVVRRDAPGALVGLLPRPGRHVRFGEGSIAAQNAASVWRVTV